MPDKDGIEIYKRFYPWPERFRLGDPVLVKEVTGMRWPEFVGALSEFEADDTPDQVVLTGLIAVAFWQGNPQMSREKARRAIELVPQDDIEIIGSDEGIDADPPAQTGAPGRSSSTTSSESAASPEADPQTELQPDSTSDETSPNGSGIPGSLSVPPESLPA